MENTQQLSYKLTVFEGPLDLLLTLIAKNKISKDSFVLFVNDGSKDKTWELIEEEHNSKILLKNRLCGSKRFFY